MATDSWSNAGRGRTLVVVVTAEIGLGRPQSFWTTPVCSKGWIGSWFVTQLLMMDAAFQLDKTALGYCRRSYIHVGHRYAVIIGPGPHWFHELQRTWFEQQSVADSHDHTLWAEHCVCFVVHFVFCSFSWAFFE